jgi:hypothetical protein
MSNWITRVDAYADRLLAGWNIYSTAIAVLLISFLLYPLFFSKSPDEHPFILANQSHASPVRQYNESPVYRSTMTNWDKTLTTGLNVKEVGAAKWVPGKDGDLRDIWRSAARGEIDRELKVTGKIGKIFTILGAETVKEHSLGMA